MKILIHDYAGHPFPTSLSRALASRGHRVIHAFSENLITPRGVLENQPGDPTSLRFAPVPMSGRYIRDKYSFLRRVYWERCYGFELTRLVRAEQPDVILSGQTPSEPQWRLSQETRRFGIPLLLWVQDFYSVAVSTLAKKKLPLVGPLAGAWYSLLDRRCFAASAHVIAITEDFRPILRRFGVEDAKISVIPNWASLDEVSVRPHENDWARRQGLIGKFTYLYAGTLAMKHNPELLWSLAVHNRNRASVSVVVVSEGPGADYLRRKQVVENLPNLRILPFQPFAEMSNVLASADVLLAVLEQDAGVFSVPSKILTYHAAGRPILAAIPRENLAARIVQEVGSGRCVEPSDVEGFLREADALCYEGRLRAEMGNKARSYAEKNFAISRIADRFELLLEGAVARRRCGNSLAQ